MKFLFPIKIHQDILESNTLDNDAGKKSSNQGKDINPKQNNLINKRVKKIISAVFEFFKIIIIALIIVLPIRYFLFQPFIVKGESMVPNFQSGDYLIVDEISYRISSPQRGNVIVLKYPLDESQRFIKRIIGLPGETIEIKDGKVSLSVKALKMNPWVEAANKYKKDDTVKAAVIKFNRIKVTR